MKEVDTNSKILKSFGRHIKDTRLSLGLTQEELAASVQSSRSFISSLELGKTNPSLLTLLKIFNALSIKDISFLFEGEDL